MTNNNQAATADSTLQAIYACVSRGNLNISSDDPVTLALWLGSMQILEIWKKGETSEEKA